VGSWGSVGQEELRRGSPRRSGDGGAAENGRRGGVQWRRGGSGGRQRAERVPTAPVREGEDGVSSNLGRRRWRLAKSDMRERPSVAGGSSTGAETVGREAALERGTGAGSVTERG
jgi:hypothetical protein